MWHASVSFPFPQRARAYRAALKHALRGVGVQSMQWVEQGNSGVWHCRRRLTKKEQEIAGAPLDIRGTPEHRERAAAAAHLFGLDLETAMEWG